MNPASSVLFILLVLPVILFQPSRRTKVAAAALLATAAFGLTIPSVQAKLVFLSWLNFPFVDLSHPRRAQLYGLFPGVPDAEHVTVQGSAGKLGGWIVQPSAEARRAQKERTMLARGASRKDVVVLYFHGNAANRALGHRLEVYRFFARELLVPVVAFDPRGYGDSAGTPWSEEDVVKDADRMWKFVRGRFADRRVLLLGHSLGTGIASGLVARLCDRGDHANILALALDAPFTSVPDVVADMTLGLVKRGLARRLLGDRLRFDSLARAARIGACVPKTLVGSGLRDWEIPSAHGERLSAAFRRGAFQGGPNPARDALSHAYVALPGGSHNTAIFQPEWRAALSGLVGAARGEVEGTEGAA
jgi:pimeloyl-ACP methyl ester carboxylesterase